MTIMKKSPSWAEVKSTLLEGLSPAKADVVSTLLENQRTYLREDATAGSVSANDIVGLRAAMMPMIRRIIPGTIATEIVGVQPMKGPVGQVHTMRYKYNESVTQPNSPFFPYAQNIAAGNELLGNVPAIRQFYAGAAGDGTPAGAPDGQDAGSSSVAQPGFTGIDGSATGGAWPSSLPAYNTTRFGPYPPTGVDAIGNAVSGGLYGGTGSFIEGSGGRSVSLEIIAQAVEAKTRKLQAGWTMEAAHDAKLQHGIDIENELVKAISAEIVQEIDSEVISDLISLAGTVSNYDYTTVGVTGYTPTFLGDRFANIGIHINAVANEIARKTRRGPGNFIVVSPMMVSVLQSAAKSVFAPAVAGSFKGPNNTMLVGTLNGTIKVYSYLWNQVSGLSSAVNDTILVGYKGGNGETDAGYFYCPYVPLMSTGVIMNAATTQPIISLMTRYGKTSFISQQTSLGNGADYYGKIVLSNFQFA